MDGPMPSAVPSTPEGEASPPSDANGGSGA